MLFHLCYIALINTIIVLLGYIIIKKRMILVSWIMLILITGIVYSLFLTEGPIMKMLALMATTFTAIKVIVVAEGYKDKALSLTFKQWVVFAIGWMGMRAQPFESLGNAPVPGAWPIIKFGISRIMAGCLLLACAHGIVALGLSHGVTYVLVSLVLLVGLSLILHFGLLSISAGMWRLSGVNTYLLFKQPAKALNLTEFWSKRWNIAFSEMISIGVFRPLKTKAGSAVALMAAFVFSGLLHELALSVPVNSGYGLPMLYFVIQGVIVLVEKSYILHKTSILHNKVIARLWTFFWVVVPVPLLFHTQFIKHVIWPLAGLSI